MAFHFIFIEFMSLIGDMVTPFYLINLTPYFRQIRQKRLILDITHKGENVLHKTICLILIKYVQNKTFK